MDLIQKRIDSIYSELSRSLGSSEMDLVDDLITLINSKPLFKKLYDKQKGD